MAGEPISIRLTLIDVLRFIAALAVLVFHYCFRAEQGGFVPPLHVPPAVVGAAAYGGMGVYLFFVISGFVIAYSAQGRSAWAFAASRIARLYPTYVLCVTLTALMLVLGAGADVSFLQFVGNLLLFPKLLKQPMIDGVYLSIQYEILFYVWVFVRILAGVFERWSNVIIGLWLALAAANLWFIDSGAVAMLFLTQYAALFATGVMLFRIRRDGWSFNAGVLLLAAIVISVLACRQEMHETLVLYHAPYSDAAYAGVMICIFGVMNLATLRREPFPMGAVMVRLGALTYPHYLLHQMIGYALITALASEAGGGIAVVVTTLFMLVVAAIVNRYFEKPVVPKVRRWLETASKKVGLEK